MKYILGYLRYKWLISWGFVGSLVQQCLLVFNYQADACSAKIKKACTVCRLFLSVHLKRSARLDLRKGPPVRRASRSANHSDL